jgi:hypothetical protein
VFDQVLIKEKAPVWPGLLSFYIYFSGSSGIDRRLYVADFVWDGGFKDLTVFGGALWLCGRNAGVLRLRLRMTSKSNDNGKSRSPAGMTS